MGYLEGIPQVVAGMSPLANTRLTSSVPESEQCGSFTHLLGYSIEPLKDLFFYEFKYCTLWFLTPSGVSAGDAVSYRSKNREGRGFKGVKNSGVQCCTCVRPRVAPSGETAIQIEKNESPTFLLGFRPIVIAVHNPGLVLFPGLILDQSFEPRYFPGMVDWDINLHAR